MRRTCGGGCCESDTVGCDSVGESVLVPVATCDCVLVRDSVTVDDNVRLGVWVSRKVNDSVFESIIVGELVTVAESVIEGVLEKVWEYVNVCAAVLDSVFVRIGVSDVVRDTDEERVRSSVLESVPVCCSDTDNDTVAVDVLKSVPEKVEVGTLETDGVNVRTVESVCVTEATSVAVGSETVGVPVADNTTVLDDVLEAEFD
eukprot:PhM_4_TR8464/c1_g1_i1/m.79105